MANTMTNPIVEHIRSTPINDIKDVEMLVNTLAMYYVNLPSIVTTMRFIFDKLVDEGKSDILTHENNVVFKTFALSNFRSMLTGLKSVDSDGGYMDYINPEHDVLLIDLIHNINPLFSIYSLDNYLQDANDSAQPAKLIPLFYEKAFSEEASLSACASLGGYTEYTAFFSNNHSWFIDNLPLRDRNDSARACFVGAACMRWWGTLQKSSTAYASALCTSFLQHAKALDPSLYDIYTTLNALDMLGNNPIQTLYQQYRLHEETPIQLPSL